MQPSDKAQDHFPLAPYLTRAGAKKPAQVPSLRVGRLWQLQGTQELPVLAGMLLLDGRHSSEERMRLPIQQEEPAVVDADSPHSCAVHEVSRPFGLWSGCRSALCTFGHLAHACQVSTAENRWRAKKLLALGETMDFSVPRTHRSCLRSLSLAVLDICFFNWRSSHTGTALEKSSRIRALIQQLISRSFSVS